MALSMVYFLFTNLLDRLHYMGDVYLYCVLKEIEVRVTVCVGLIVLYCKCVIRGMMIKGREKVNPNADI